VNPAAKLLFGRPAEQLLGVAFGFPVIASEIELLRPDGSMCIVEMRASELTWEGQPANLISLRDVTVHRQAERRIEHLNEVLRAIRNVNQLIVREKDRTCLLQNACNILVETRGYYSAWIALTDNSGRLVEAVEAGLGETFQLLVEQLERGQPNDCMQAALAQANVLTIPSPGSMCTGCPLCGGYADKGALAVRLEHAGEIFGLLTVSVPKEVAVDKEELSLFDEIAKDLGIALYSVAVDEKRKQAETEIMELSRFPNENPNPVLRISSEGVLMYANKSSEGLLETWQCKQGMRVPDDLRQMVSETVKAGVSREFEIDSNTRFFSFVFSPVLKSNYVNGYGMDITDRKRAQDEIRHRLGELEVLYASSLVIGKSLQRQKIGQEIINILSERLHWHHAALRMYHPESETIELLAIGQPKMENETEQLAAKERFRTMISRPGQGLSGWVIQHGQSVYSRDVTQDPRYLEVEPGIRSGMYVPLKVGERTIGCLSVESEKIDAFSETDEWLISTLAAQAASALENARLYDETQRSLKQSTALRAIDQAITGSPNLQLVLQVALKHVITDLGVDAAVILLYNPKEQTLQYELGKGFRASTLRHTRLRLGEGYAGRAALGRQTIVISDLHNRKTDFLRSPTFQQEGFVHYFGVPLIAKDEIVGVLEIFHRTALNPDLEWLGFMESLAGQIAIAIDNATLFRDLQRSNMDLIKAYDATIEGWSKALDFRDKETEDHTLRVTEMTLALASATGVSNEKELMFIRWGGLLHDIGKIGIPDSILHKVDKLTDEEWKVIQQHPSLAYELLNPIEFLHPALDIPYCHHEKWDGTGYPRGLKGDQIPLAARLFSIVDVWDALLSDRPYRAGWPEEKILAYIREQAGIHFDPQAVDIFETLRLGMGAQMDFSKLAPPRLLIVDDEENVLHSLSRSLRDSFAVLTARSGLEALELLGHEKVAVILTDQRMPDMTGLDLLQEAQKAFPGTPGVLFSGYSDSASLAATLKLDNVHAYIPKPWDLDDLQRQLHTVIKRNGVIPADVEKSVEADSDDG
jgi:response regulator RpfG family c-di-GMP phosphodiesterase